MADLELPPDVSSSGPESDDDLLELDDDQVLLPPIEFSPIDSDAEDPHVSISSCRIVPAPEVRPGVKLG